MATLSVRMFVLTLILALPAFRASAQTTPESASAAQTAVVPARITQARITQAIDETQLVRLRGNVHPLARPEFDQGIVSDAAPMNRMLLLLQRSPEQQAALSKFMAAQPTQIFRPSPIGSLAKGFSKSKSAPDAP